MHIRHCGLCGLAGLILLIPAAGSAQSISIVSGNGQLVCPPCSGAAPNFDPLVVVVKDATGAPVPNATINWTVAAGSGVLANPQTTTDPNGQSSNTFSQSAPLGFPLSSFLQSTVTAAVGSSTIQFTETLTLVLFTASSTVPQDVLSGQAGQQAGQPIQVQLQAISGGGAPGVEVRLDPVDPASPSQVVCAATPGLAPNTTVTDANGNAACTPVFLGKVGSGQVILRVGNNFYQSPPIPFQVTVGPAAMIQVITGNNQSANPGATLPLPLVAAVSDLAGNPVAGASVAWTITQGNATLLNTKTQTDASGRVYTNVKLGNSAGAVQIQVALAGNTAVAATFSAGSNAVITQLQKMAGDSQVAAVNTAFPQPLVVQVNNQGQPVRGVVVQFAVAGGSITLGAATVSTDAQGRAQTTVQAGATPGPASVSASASAFTVSFNLTVRPPGPVLTSGSFYNAASFQQGAISPCGLATIAGPGLAPGVQGSIVPTFFGPLPYQVAGVLVSFHDTASDTDVYAPIYSVVNSGGQESVTIQVPCELTPGTASTTVRAASGSTTLDVPVQSVSPGIFETVMSDGKRRAVLLRPDGSFASLENAVKPPENVRLFVTGIGPVNPAIATNQIGVPDRDLNVQNPIVVGVGGTGVNVVSARHSRNLIGVYEVTFQVPSNAPLGDSVALGLAVLLPDGTSVYANYSALPIKK